LTEQGKARHERTPGGVVTMFVFPPAPPRTVVYDYGVLLPGAGHLQCPCGRTDNAERAVRVLTEHLDGAPVGARGVIFVRDMAKDGTTGPAQLYALAERGEGSVIWPDRQEGSPEQRGPAAVTRTVRGGMSEP
jgi:hypothetical protein